MRQWPVQLCCLLLGGAISVHAQDADYSEIAPLAVKSLLLDLTAAGPRLVAVGDRGHILLSDDRGARWRQVKTPTQAMLTAVWFVDTRHGWAVGHDETILRSTDGGETWEKTYSEPEGAGPLLDVWFRDTNYGLAIGAYGRLLESEDGGKTWAERAFDPKPMTPGAKPANEDEETPVGERHLNAIARSGSGKLYIAAEAGHLFRSDDDGKTWLILPSPYDGSFFGVLPLEGESLLAFGLRGHLFRSEDAGRTWTELESGSAAMLTGATRQADGGIALSGLAGTLLLSRDGGRSFTPHQQTDRKGLQALLPLDGGKLLAVGEGGVKVLAP